MAKSTVMAVMDRHGPGWLARTSPPTLINGSWWARVPWSTRRRIDPVPLPLRGAGVLERLALRVGLVPAPAAEAWGGMALAGVLVAAVRLGVTARLAAGPATVDQLCAELGLARVPTRLLLECLRSGRHV